MSDRIEYIINEAVHQRPGILRLDVRVLESYKAYSAVAMVLPGGDIQIGLKSRHMPPIESFTNAVHAYLADEPQSWLRQLLGEEQGT